MGMNAEHDDMPFEPVLETHSAGERAFLKSILDGEGIVYYIEGEHAATYLFNSVPQRVMVRKDHADVARDLLSTVERRFI